MTMQDQRFSSSSKPDDETPSGRSLRLLERAPAGDEQVIDDESGDYNIKLLQPLFAYIRDKFGEDTLADVVHDCGLPASILVRKTGWIGSEPFEHVLAASRELVESDEEFMRACAFEVQKQYGPFLLILRCMSVDATYRLMAKTVHMVCAGTMSTFSGPRNTMRIRYSTTRSESRLCCFSRQAGLRSVPTLFLGMPPAKVVERSCVAHGDDCCEYELAWHEPLRVRRLFVGVLVGLLVAMFMPSSMMHGGVAYALLPMMGALLGAVVELRRVLRGQARFIDETSEEIEQVVLSHAHATDELSRLRERERDWNRHVEAGVAARTRKLNAVVDRLRTVIRQRSDGFPVVRKTTSAQAVLRPGTDPRSERLASMETAVDRVSQLVGELVDIASDDTTKRDLQVEECGVDQLVTQIRRQLKATMIGRDVRITVFQTREAPATVRTIRPILERVIDNVLLNASRHTERGSVVVEASGTPGSLLIKLSDTGSGISKERLERVFENDADTSGDRSGLAYAARMLDHLGGRLEIMSEPGMGTTLWLYIPVESSRVDASPDAASTSARGGDHLDAGPSSPSEDGMVGRVVRIRSSQTAAAAVIESER